MRSSLETDYVGSGQMNGNGASAGLASWSCLRKISSCKRARSSDAGNAPVDDGLLFRQKRGLRTFPRPPHGARNGGATSGLFRRQSQRPLHVGAHTCPTVEAFVSASSTSEGTPGRGTCPLPCPSPLLHNHRIETPHSTKNAGC